MGDQISIQLGERPWQPTDKTELLEEFHRYNRPLAGVLRQEGNLYYFACVDGHADDWSLWAYTLIDEHDVLRLREESADVETAFVEAANPVSLAIANEIEGIVESARLVQTGRTLRESAVESFEYAGERLRSILGQPLRADPGSPQTRGGLFDDRRH